MAEGAPSPFTPGYGRKPAIFGGHGEELNELKAVFDTLDFGENHSVLVSGLRGVGKTSFLTTLQDAAREAGWLVISDDASAGLMSRVMDSTIPTLINEMTPATRARLTNLGIWEFSAEIEYIDRHRTVKPQLRTDLVALSTALGGTGGVLITIDEVSSGKVRLRELSKFALQVSHALEDGAQIMVVFAGVKVSLDALLAEEHTTFLRRSREIEFERLSAPETRRVFVETAGLGGRSIDADALDKLVSLAQGYPYLVQLAGDYAWRNDSNASSITLADATVAHDRAIRAVESRVISRVYGDLSDVDQKFLDAMAEDDDRTKVADIVKRMGVSDAYVQVYKKRLIDSGYVHPVGHGYVQFSLPYLGAYIRRRLAAEAHDGGEDGGWHAYPAPDLPS
ncbi:ATP-binding protein [Microbacterium sp. zg.Y909]|uniref:ATP-binding protein n=1 Tax=Microbacterium sp. zg.Y909 TaxID=2969413 RepID=UPI00214B0D0E|nr:ATP-binding protein [Microbacterium sp. zg.Y909]MCR2824648.1 ATP-binding protein [Microbacterium sp. zg.Y909]